ncbi:hypothetical protein [Mucilaginibacter polytrichastri]|nr:hypothetical protein [Mucilaginibacter polytrichastri]SFS97252.1 hypothetical protein SAMN04487890_107195 [Mucilaginibacter polytrichastri]
MSLIVEIDVNDNEIIKNKITALDAKVQQMLLWSNLSAIWGYLLLSGIIVRIYRGLNGTHAVFLIGTLGLVCLLLVIYLFVVWKSIAYQQNTRHRASKEYLNYQINKLVGQRKLIAAYLITNVLLLTVASLFFGIDLNRGITTLFKIAAPVSIITYGLGLYFISNFTRQKRKLDDLNKQIDHVLFMEKVNQN